MIFFKCRPYGLLLIWVVFANSLTPTSLCASGSPKDRAQRAFRRGKYSMAKSILTKAIKNNKNDLHAWALLAATNFHLGQPKRTLHILRKNFYKSPNKSYNLYYQGLAYQLIERKQKAKSWCGYPLMRVLPVRSTVKRTQIHRHRKQNRKDVTFIERFLEWGFKVLILIALKFFYGALD